MVAAKTFIKYILLFLATFPLNTTQVPLNINLCIFNIEVSHQRKVISILLLSKKDQHVYKCSLLLYAFLQN